MAKGKHREDPPPKRERVRMGGKKAPPPAKTDGTVAHRAYEMVADMDNPGKLKPDYNRWASCKCPIGTNHTQ